MSGIAEKYVENNQKGLPMPGLYQRLQEQKESILAIARHYHAANVRVFGSVTRGEEGADSDIDLLVEFLPGSTLIDQAGLIEALTNALGRRVDVVSERALNKHLKSGILSEALPLQRTHSKDGNVNRD